MNQGSGLGSSKCQVTLEVKLVIVEEAREARASAEKEKQEEVFKIAVNVK
jgi:hypothetical protein